MVKIGVTGIMGSGKTLVSGMFGRLGAEVINADEIVRSLLLPGTEVSAAIEEAFGEAVLQEGGVIDRKKLAGEVFVKNPENLARLNAIIHPEVFNIIESKIASAVMRRTGFLVIDAPLLVETKLDKKCDYTVVVSSSRENALDRLALAGKASPEDFSARMRFQLGGAAKEKKADFIVDNNGSVNETEVQVRKIWKRITGGGK